MLSKDHTYLSILIYICIFVLIDGFSVMLGTWGSELCGHFQKFVFLIFTPSLRAHLSISETTGYDWSEISSEAQNGEQQLFAEIEILAGSVVEIQQTKGTCGDSTVSTELLRTVVTKKNGEVVSSVNFKQ